MNTRITNWGYDNLNERDNPIWRDDWKPNEEIKLDGLGKICLISYIASEPHTLLNINVDNKGWKKVNNVYCMNEVDDGEFIKVRIKQPKDFLFPPRYKGRNTLYQITVKIPIIFKKTVSFKLTRTERGAQGLHIYYLVPKEI